ncbi:shikimate kinase [Desulfonatronum thiodismutans]|uniref:shikimate kinase n=1 Tax=Desulfonatronum thiodismutans TaxID=159290 RepID=UPI0004ABDB52|nr:hypothetical protein [Desulfonatronum thiodismutans]
MRNALSELNQYVCDNTAMMARIFQVLDQEPMPETARECIVYNFLLLFAEHQLLLNHCRPSDVVFAEEGFAQVGSMLYGYLPSRVLMADSVAAYLDQLPPLRAVVWIDTPPEVCCERLKQRSAMPIVLQKDSEKEVLAFLEQARNCFQRIANGLTDRNIEVFTIPHLPGAVEEALSMVSHVAREIASAGLLQERVDRCAV